MDREKVIKGLEEAEIMLIQAVDRGGKMAAMGALKCLNRVTDAIALLKAQEAEIRQLRLALDIATKETCKEIKSGGGQFADMPTMQSAT